MLSPRSKFTCDSYDEGARPDFPIGEPVLERARDALAAALR
jgi:hypothetical protein